MSDVAERVRNVVVYHLEVDAKEVNDGVRFMEDLGADSIAMVELHLALEDEFGVEISDNEAESILTVGAAIKLVQEKTGTSPTQKRLSL